MNLSKSLYRVSHFLGLTRLVAWFNRNRVTVLCYHSVTNNQDEIANDPWKLSLDTRDFEKQLEFLKKHYNVISLHSYLEARKNKQPIKPYSVVLTFDDGPRNFFTLTAPLLEKYKFPATVMVITDLVEDISRRTNGAKPRTEWAPDDDSKYMTWNEIRMLQLKQEIDCGSHTCSHSRLSLLPLEDAAVELQNSRKAILENTKQTSVTFSYPHGLHTPELATLVQESGYTCAMTIVDGGNKHSDNPFQLRRDVVLADDGMAKFAARLSGLASYWPWFRALCRPYVKQLFSTGYTPSLGSKIRSADKRTFDNP